MCVQKTMCLNIYIYKISMYPYICVCICICMLPLADALRGQFLEAGMKGIHNVDRSSYRSLQTLAPRNGRVFTTRTCTKCTHNLWKLQITSCQCSSHVECLAICKTSVGCRAWSRSSAGRSKMCELQSMLWTLGPC